MVKFDFELDFKNDINLDARLFLFGSSANGFGTHGADMDMCLGPMEEDLPVKTLRKILERKSRMSFSFS